jgi:protein-disulfide isomerase
MAQAAAGVNRFYLILGAAALAGIAALVYQVQKPKAVSIPVNVSVLTADTAGFRGYFLGSDSAKVEVTEYADYQCPVCRISRTSSFRRCGNSSSRPAWCAGAIAISRSKCTRTHG